MRLERIKLTGFKSFVDSTVVHFPGNLIGIVGPNGCGKSNIIDAVRWVMGESSAKQLRGESITDVIFNGSSQRKPIGQAAIELIFDNSDATVGGEYAQYNQISVKRLVTRDAQSFYFLNGAKCRRRDITDLFLGTGLGPRSYSIIEQGMISRIIEAKPEDLRAYFEEVAGISKYRERRRETENRIRHTKENLSRITDLRDEIGKQLDRLKRQANAAERYKVLKEEERLLKAQFLALRFKRFHKEYDYFNEALKKQEIILESHKAQLQQMDTAIEKQLDMKNQYSDEFNAIQSQYYQLGNEVTRLEQDIAHRKDRLFQLKTDLKKATENYQTALAGLSLDEKNEKELTLALQELKPKTDLAKSETEYLQKHLLEAETKRQDWQMAWDEFNQKAAEVSQSAQIEKTRIQHLEEEQQQVGKRLVKIEEEKRCLSVHQLKIELDHLLEEEKTLQETHQELEKALQEGSISLSSHKTKLQTLDDELNRKRQMLQKTEGQKVSLEALQQAALGKKNKAINDWLTHYHLQNHERLAEKLSVEAGFEKAFEAVLGQHLQAVCVTNTKELMQALSSLTDGALTLFEPDHLFETTSTRHGVETLSSKLKTNLPLSSLLEGVFVVDTLFEAMALRDSLAVGESVVTKEGVWLGRNWLRVVKEANMKGGIIQREEELRHLNTQIKALKQELQQLETNYLSTKEALKKSSFSYEQTQSAKSECSSKLAHIRAKTDVKTLHIRQTEERIERLHHEMEEQQTALAKSKEKLNESRHVWNEAMQRVEASANEREKLLLDREKLKTLLDESRIQLQKAKDASHQLALEIQAKETRLSSCRLAIDRITLQIKTFKEHHAQLEETLKTSIEPIGDLEKELEIALEKRLAIEQKLTHSKQLVDNLNHEIQQFLQKQQEADQAVQRTRADLEHKRLQGQEIKVRCQTLQEQIDETSFTLEELLNRLTEEATEETGSQAIEQMAQRINRLGPINLAAIDEFEQETERKTYLDAQQADLDEALQTLQNAIRKIDKESRTRFKDTFDQVNKNFQELFPKVFGGGKAYLELTDEDLLQTGITVLARPPGKRVTSIHLLSGGEKALTAIALIFSMFQLNPAPFCLLDEVDAPLDDSNVGRFCDLVREMSEKVQFIFISHNKVAIEMAHHLAGVTMHEPGVSRIVTVSIDDAIAMTEA